MMTIMTLPKVQRILPMTVVVALALGLVFASLADWVVGPGLIQSSIDRVREQVILQQLYVGMSQERLYAIVRGAGSVANGNNGQPFPELRGQHKPAAAAIVRAVQVTFVRSYLWPCSTSYGILEVNFDLTTDTVSGWSSKDFQNGC